MFYPDGFLVSVAVSGLTEENRKFMLEQKQEAGRGLPVIDKSADALRVSVRSHMCHGNMANEALTMSLYMNNENKDSIVFKGGGAKSCLFQTAHKLRHRIRQRRIISDKDHVKLL